jgi:hypothetical protein
MIQSGRCRRLINQDVDRVRALFRWTAGVELYPGEAQAALAAVEALPKGRCAAREHPPIAPVAEAVVLATLPHLSVQVAAMVRLQLLTAARPGEVCSLRPRNVDRSDPAGWVYRPGSHKTEHHGRERVIALGPRVREVLRPWLDRDQDANCFSPAEVVVDCEAVYKPVNGSGRKSSRLAARPKLGGRYTDEPRPVIATDAIAQSPTPRTGIPGSISDPRPQVPLDFDRQASWVNRSTTGRILVRSRSDIAMGSEQVGSLVLCTLVRYDTSRPASLLSCPSDEGKDRKFDEGWGRDGCLCPNHQ